VLDRNLSTVCKVLLVLSVLLLGANRALAYTGPGADVTFIGQAMTLLWWLLAVFSAVLLWPVYALLNRIRGRKNKSTMTSSLGAAPEKARAVNSTDS
jgi:hypothetical protein